MDDVEPSRSPETRSVTVTGHEEAGWGLVRVQITVTTTAEPGPLPPDVAAVVQRVHDQMQERLRGRAGSEHGVTGDDPGTSD